MDVHKQYALNRLLLVVTLRTARRDSLVELAFAKSGVLVDFARSAFASGIICNRKLAFQKRHSFGAAISPLGPASVPVSNSSLRFVCAERICKRHFRASIWHLGLALIPVPKLFWGVLSAVH